MAPPNDSESSMRETVALIEKGVDDIKKNKATKAEVIELIDERVNTDSEAFKKTQAELAEVKSEAEELKAVAEETRKQLRRLRANRYEAIKDPYGNYRGIFRSPEEAKAVGLAIMASTMAAGVDLPAVKAKRNAILKALDDMGADIKWLDEEGRRIEKAATTSSQASGSALVTTEQAPGLIMLLESYGKFRANAMHVPMGAGQTLQPKLDTLLTVYVPGEGTAPTQTDPTIGMLGLITKTLTALSAYSLELDEDSAIPLAELYGDLFARSFAYYEDLCGFLGDGTSTYFGFKGICGALLAVDATIANIKSLIVGAGNSYSELTLANFESVAGKLPVYADDESARWFVHKYFFFTVMLKLALAAGGATASEIIATGASRKKTFLGYDVEYTQVMPSAEANSQICALLANLRMAAMLGIRGGLEFAQSDQRYFDQGLVAVRGRNRVAINAHGVGDTTKAGPVIGLITAAS